MAESRGGRGDAVLTGFRLHRPAAEPSDRGQIPRSFGQECPWSRYPGMLWYLQMPRPLAREPRTTGTQCRVWTGPQLRWHINYLELLAVRLALSRLRGRLRGRDVLVRTDNTATIAYINRQGGLRSRRMSQLARHLLLWSQKHLRSLRAIHIPGVFNRAADELSRAALPGGSADLEAVRSCSGRPVCISRNHPLPVVLLPSRGNARHGCTGTQLAPGPAQICVSPTEPTSTDTVQDQGGRGARGQLGQYGATNRTWFPELMLLAIVPPWPIPLSKDLLSQRWGTLWHPRPDLWKVLEVLGDLPQEVALTIASARAPSTRWAYALKWNLFVEWCSSHHEDPRRCSIRAVLSFLQQVLERRLSLSTLKGLVHPKMTILSLITHPHVIPNP